AAIVLLAMTLGGRAVARDASVEDRPGVDVGLRVGYAIPFGNVTGTQGDKLANLFSGAEPLVLEAGYRIKRAITVGALFQYAFGQIKDSGGMGCSGNVSCSASVTRLGVEGIYHVPVPGDFVPFVGFGVGYEWMKANVSSTFGNLSAGA